MKLAAYALLSVVLLFLTVPPLSAQRADSSFAPVAASAVSGLDAPDACHNFTVTAGNDSIFYCVSDNGNITSIQTPVGHEQIGVNGEGYGLCQESPATEYHDYASDASSNWAAAHIVSLKGGSIKISRFTADNNWTLVQTITKVAATASIKVVMALTNNQSVDKVAYLVRYAHTDVDGHSGNGNGQIGGGSFNSAWAWVFYQGYGLQLQSIAKSPFAYQQGFVRFQSAGPNACDFAYQAGGSAGTYTLMSIEYVYAGPVPAHGTRTVTLSYHAI